MTGILTKVDQAGRLSIPGSHRRALGLEAGAPVVVTLVGSELHVRSAAEAMRALQREAAEILAGDAASTQAFVAERRREASEIPADPIGPDLDGH